MIKLDTKRHGLYHTCGLKGQPVSRRACGRPEKIGPREVKELADKLRVYESMFIIAPDVPEDERNALVGKALSIIKERVEGTLEESLGEGGIERWGLKKFAYKIKGYTEGDYVIIYFRAKGDKRQELEHFYRVTPQIIRWQTFRRYDIEKKERKSKKKESEVIEEKVE